MQESQNLRRISTSYCFGCERGNLYYWVNNLIDVRTSDLALRENRQFGVLCAP